MKFSFEFELTDAEVQEFKKEIRSSLNGKLPLDVLVQRDGSQRVEVRKQGRGGTTLGKKATNIARFVGSRVDIKHIPAIRTGRAAESVVQELVEEELRTLEESSEYKAAVETIADIQAPVLRELETKLHTTLAGFMPNIKQVQIRLTDRYSALRRDCEILIDDGYSTPLERKGDGVKSLAAMSLAHYQARTVSANADGLPVLAFEEPEAHLHPNAVASLVGILEGIATTQQVVISTHNPILIRRNRVDSNILVHKNRAKAARSIGEIRDLLGVRVQDNLSSAELVLVTEGVTDVRVLSALLHFNSEKLSAALTSGRLAIVAAQGAPNLPNQVVLYRGLLCQVHVFADNDGAGLNAVRKCQALGHLAAGDYSLAVAVDRKESELEDLINHEVYAESVGAMYGTSFPGKMFTRSNSKWTKRMDDEMRSCGKALDAEATKHLVAHCVERDPGNAIYPHSHGVLLALIDRLSSRLN